MKNEKTLGYEEIYNIPQPYSNGRVIVYGEREMAWYDYVIVNSIGCTESRSNVGYSAAEIALRDALIKVTT